MSAASRGAPSGSRAALVAIWLASLAVLGGVLLAAFRLGFAEDLADAPPRRTGRAAVRDRRRARSLALAGALRRSARARAPLRELELFALVAGAAGGGFALAQLGRCGACAARSSRWAPSRGGGARLARRPRARPAAARREPRRAVLLGRAIGVARCRHLRARAHATPSRPRSQPGCSAISARGAVRLRLPRCSRAPRSSARSRCGVRSAPSGLALAASVSAAGAVGPLAFVGTLRAARRRARLAPSASRRVCSRRARRRAPPAVAAVDAVPRLLVGGYDFPWNVSAALLAIPIFLGWNRARLRREVGGPASLRGVRAGADRSR